MLERKKVGSVVKKRGKFAYRLRINGKEKLTYLKATTKEEAEEEADIYRPIASSNTLEDLAYFVAKAKKLINEEDALLVKYVWSYFENSAERKACSEKSLQQHNMHWNIFSSWLAENYPGIKRFNDVNRNIANEFCSYINEIYKGKKSFNYVLITMKYISRLVLNTDNHPFAKIRKKHVETLIRKEFTVKQFKRIFNFFDDPRLKVDYLEQIKLVFYLGAYTGMRLKNCILFRDDQVNWETDMVKCVPDKTKKIRPDLYVHIKMHPDLKQQLILARNRISNGFYSPDLVRRYRSNTTQVYKDNNAIINYVIFEKKYKNLTNKKKIETKTAYSFGSFRHSFVSFCANADVPLDKVAAIVGHSSKIMTRYYTHVDKKAFDKVINALPNV